MASNTSGAAKRRKNKILESELKRCKLINSFMLPAQTQHEETQSATNAIKLENALQSSSNKDDTREIDPQSNSDFQDTAESHDKSYKDNIKIYL